MGRIVDGRLILSQTVLDLRKDRREGEGGEKEVKMRKKVTKRRRKQGKVGRKS